MVGSSGGEKNMHEGKEYDFVFTVELDEGGTLKLPYNRTDDPYTAAQAFLTRHQIPQDRLDEVAKFIIRNAGAGGGGGADPAYVDPFTGGSR